MAETEVPPWLKALPLAPEFHPTEADFLDPIDYIFKIEAEAAQYGICKIVPPYMKAPKRVVFNNLNFSLANSQDAPDKSSADAPLARSMGPARSMSGCVPTGLGLEIEAGGKAKFTTRRQQLGWNARKSRTALPQAVVHKLVWQSGETYTLDQFEAKAKTFARNRLGTSQEVGPLAIEALFWKAAMEKAISIEYANDIPGSAFAEPKKALATLFHPSSTTTNHKRRRGLDESATTEPLIMDNNINGFGQEEEDKGECDEEMMVLSGDEADASKNSLGVECSTGGDNVRGIGCKLSNSAWNMRKVARSPGSLLRFIPDEVPGVTSPMVYIGMLFSWFAWHVEDHELHSLNYLHTGAPKTWYAVPGDAAPALEEVVRVQGYAGQLNPRDAFARLGEKTTVMSPEVLAAAGVPCCRLVQNAGEYVVTFPRAYHLGFSHGFNCGEAANFATPGWLNVAREASVRRAAMNYLPMLSHQQLLYMLATSITSRSLFDTTCEKRSSRLKEKKRNGEEVVKCMFVNDVIQQNDFLGKLLDNGGARCLMVKDTKFCTPCPPTTLQESILHPDSLDKDVRPTTTEEKVQNKQELGVLIKGNLPEIPLTETPIPIEMEVAPISDSKASSGEPNKPSESTTTSLIEVLSGNDHLTTPELPLDLSTLPCAACGVLCFSEMAVVQPSQTATAKFRPLKSHASGAGSHRAKGHDSSLTGLLPGKADKKSADFHMLPTTAGVVPSLELEETTTPDQYADGSYDENQNEREPEIWTPDLKEECPSTKDCSNEATTLDTEVLDTGLASAGTEGGNNYLCEVDKVQVTCEGVDTYNCTEDDSLEVDKQNDEVVSGPTNQLSNASKCEVAAFKAPIPEIIVSNPGEGTTLSSLQLLAFAYDNDSDLDDSDEEENGNNVEEVTVVSTPPLESNRHTGAPSNNCFQTSSSAIVECQSAVVTTDKYETQDTSSLLPAVKNDAKVDKNRPPTSFGGSKDIGTVVLAQSEGCLDPPPAMHLLDSCESSPTVTTSSSRTGIDIAPTCKVESEILGANNQDGLTLDRVPTTLDIVAVAVAVGVSFVDEAKHRPVLRLGECVTCSLPHDSFFDSFEETASNVAMKSGTSSAALDSCPKRIEVVQQPGCEVVNVPSIITAPPDQNNNLVVAEQCLQQGGELCDHVVESGSTIMSNVVGVRKSGEPMDIHTGGVKHITTSGASEGQFGNLEPIQVDSVLNQSQVFKGAARPRVLCLEHAVLAQQRLVSIGGANVIVVCHSGFTSIEQQAKEVGAEVGANHEWRSVPFQQPGNDEFQVINAAVEAEEESMPGDSDWVEQLGLSVHGQDKVDFLNLNPSNEESEDIGSRAGRKGRKSNLREKKSSIIGQWCGKQWRSDQLHPLLGGCRDIMASQVEITTLNPANLWPASGGVSTFENNGRSRKVMRPARLSEYTPDGRAPKTDAELKKSGRKRKTLLDNSEDEVDEQNSDSIPTTRICGPEDASTQTTREDSVWRDVPIASTDSFLLPHLSAGPGVVTVRGPDHNETVAFTPESMFSAAKEMRRNSTDSEAFHSEVSHHSCSVVGGFLQRGAKLQALQKLCRQLSTPVSVPCSPLTTPVRFPSRVRPSSHTKISTAKLVSRLKRKHHPADVLSLVVKKRKAEKDITTPPVQKESTTSLLQIDGGEIVNIDTNTENDKLSKLIVGEEEVKEELSPVTHDILFENDGGGLRVRDSDNQSENNGLEEVKRNLEEGMDLSLEEENDTTTRPNQELKNEQNEDQQDASSSKKNKFEYGGGCASSGNVVESQEQSYHVLTPQTPNLDSNSIFCTESLPQGLLINEQAKPEPTTLFPSPTDFKPIAMTPRIGRVRGKRTKCLEWKSCIQISDFRHKEEDENPCQTWDENHTLGEEEGISDSVEPTPTTTKGGTDPDFFPYSNCLTSSATRVRRRRVSTPGMVDWGVSKKGNNNEAEGVADAHLDVKQETKTKKHKKGQKASAGNKRCEELEGEFQCNMDGCIMAFDTIRDLQLHKKNLCTWKGCGKHFHMHKYLLQHRRVHLDDRPLKCPWKGCTQAFKWAWARTEHIRVHTGERPYKCLVSGCGQTFRFVSDFSRHKRNTGHRPT